MQLSALFVITGSIKHYIVLTSVKESSSENFDELHIAKCFSVLFWGLEGVFCCFVGFSFSLSLLLRLMLFWAEFFFQSCRQICIIIVGLLCAVASGTSYWFHSCPYRSQPFMWTWKDFLIRSCSDEVFFLKTAIHA